MNTLSAAWMTLDAVANLCAIGQIMAEGGLPENIRRAMCLCKLTAIKKTATKVRGLNAADPFKRLVARTLAQQYAPEFREATKAFNYGLCEHSGTESVIHYIRNLCDRDPNACVTKIDGVGAFDHIYRSAMLAKLRHLPTAHRLIPFIMSTYGEGSVYIWTDNENSARHIHQGEGGEQGDALMPALFCLGLHDALERANANLRPGEKLLAYLDDVYIISSPDRARAVYDNVTQEISSHIGIQVNFGKTECWSPAGGPPPVGIAELDAPAPLPPVWKGNLTSEHNGIEILGSPIGQVAYIDRVLNDKLDEETKLLDNLQHMSRAQVSWLLLFFCGAPRSNYILRTVPPSLCARYAESRDGLIRQCLGSILHIDPEHLARTQCCSQLHMPAKYGGLGLQSSIHVSPCAYWASWCDAVPVLSSRIPGFEQDFLASMIQAATVTHDISLHACSRILHEAVIQLQYEGY